MMLVIPAIPPSLNKYLRMHFQARKRVNDEWREWIWAAAQEYLQKVYRGDVMQYYDYPMQKAKVTLAYFFSGKGRRDPDNYSGKVILDGLRHAGVLEDDSFGNVVLELRAAVDKKNPRTEIEVTREE